MLVEVGDLENGCLVLDPMLELVTPTPFVDVVLPRLGLAAVDPHALPVPFPLDRTRRREPIEEEANPLDQVSLAAAIPLRP